DIGSTKVCCVVAGPPGPGEPDELTIYGVGEVPSEGLRKGVIVNLERTVKAIEAAVQAAERMSGHRVESVYAGLAGQHMRSLNSRGVVAVASGDREINQKDVDRVIDAARTVAIPSDSEVIHVMPRGFVVDGQEGVRDAVGMSGSRLEVETHIIAGATTAVQNVVKAVHAAGFNVDDLVTQSLASAEAVLNDNELDLGVAVADIGGGTTDLAVFADGSVHHTAVIPVGGNHVTNDLAIGLRTSLADAEAAKINYGHALPHLIPKDEVIDIQPIGAERVQGVPRIYLAEIINPRAREIVELLRVELERSGQADLLPGGLVLTGGGAKLLGLPELAAEMLDLPVRVGVPINVRGMSDKVAGPSFATAVGLLKWGAKLTAPAHASNGASAVSIAEIYQRSVRWLRDFF
ncbi:MAG TPA: cell division protein FtsA, partial [Candidatus Dormibacteraeota bacterium]|nr:cell division protein FtsA [Candidatus Dormibacteraeota bacterium]